ncbi:hypothetical protein Hdeb2414_s0009g00305581 [Helianthus debilis subsp. tardiflorus]
MCNSTFCPIFFIKKVTFHHFLFTEVLCNEALYHANSHYNAPYCRPTPLRGAL